jgi:hypothetical protein
VDDVWRALAESTVGYLTARKIMQSKTRAIVGVRPVFEGRFLGGVDVASREAGVFEQ